MRRNGEMEKIHDRQRNPGGRVQIYADGSAFFFDFY